MRKKIILMLLVILNLILFCSCDNIMNINKEGMFVSEEKKVDIRMEQIISALESKDPEKLKLLFSIRSLDEVINFDDDANCLFELFQGRVDNLKSDGWFSEESIRSGKQSLMIGFSFDVTTDTDNYHFFVIDYNTDTINPDNQGLYMLELIKFTEQKNLDAWQDRMRAGIYIH